MIHQNANYSATLADEIFGKLMSSASREHCHCISSAYNCVIGRPMEKLSVSENGR